MKGAIQVTLFVGRFCITYKLGVWSSIKVAVKETHFCRYGRWVLYDSSFYTNSILFSTGIFGWDTGGWGKKGTKHPGLISTYLPLHTHFQKAFTTWSLEIIQIPKTSGFASKDGEVCFHTNLPGVTKHSKSQWRKKQQHHLYINHQCSSDPSYLSQNSTFLMLLQPVCCFGCFKGCLCLSVIPACVFVTCFNQKSVLPLLSHMCYHKPNVKRPTISGQNIHRCYPPVTYENLNSWFLPGFVFFCHIKNHTRKTTMGLLKWGHPVEAMEQQLAQLGGVWEI